MSRPWPSWILVRSIPAIPWLPSSVMPRRLLDLTPDEAAAAMRTAQRVAQAVKDAFDPPGRPLLQANGKEGDQTVFHFHLHVVPRHGDDGIALLAAQGSGACDTLEGYAARLRQALACLGGTRHAGGDPARTRWRRWRWPAVGKIGPGLLVRRFRGSG